MSTQDPAHMPPTPQAQLMQMSMGYTTTSLLRAAAQLRLADHIATGPKTAADIAKLTNTHAPSLHRLLRTLAGIGIFTEDASHRFSLTPLSEPLRTEVPGSVRNAILGATSESHTVAWSKLSYSVQTGKPSFDHDYGMPFFEYLKGEPDETKYFFEMLIAMNSQDAPAISAAYDFTPFSHIMDIGGATGHILTTILAAHPGPRGTIFDQAYNQSGAAELLASRHMTERVDFVVGSFFESVPAGADLHILSHIIHDWSESESLTILKNSRSAIAPNGKLILVEMVLTDGNSFHPGKMLDMTMLALTTGQERTEPEYRELLAKANYKLTRVIPTYAAVSIVEAEPV